jgi:hypothetical protein
VRGSCNERNYDLAQDAGFRRDSHGLETDGGLRFEVTRLLIGQIYAGYLPSRPTIPIQQYRRRHVSAQLNGITRLTTVDSMPGDRFRTRPSGASSYTSCILQLASTTNCCTTSLSASMHSTTITITTCAAQHAFWGFSVGAMYLLNRNLGLISVMCSPAQFECRRVRHINNLFRVGLVRKL